MQKLLQMFFGISLSMEIIFDKDFPPAVQVYVGDLLNECVWLVPVWIQRFRVGWNGDAGILATMQTEKDYRYCRLTIHPEFLEHGRKYQTQIFYHEIFHTYNTPAIDTAKQYIETLCDELKNETLKDVMIKTINAKMEASTEDFSYAIVNKFNDKNKN